MTAWESVHGRWCLVDWVNVLTGLPASVCVCVCVCVCARARVHVCVAQPCHCFAWMILTGER